MHVSKPDHTSWLLLLPTPPGSAIIVCAAMKVRLKFGGGGSNGGMEH